MPKVATSLVVEGQYFPRILTDEESKEYENIGYKSIEISQEVIDKWKEHCKQVKDWHKFWAEIDNKIWEEEG